MEKILRETLNTGKFENVPITRSKMMGAIKGANNKSTELAFQQALIAAGISHFKTNAKLPGNPDIYFPSYQLVVFLDGCFWHGCPQCGHIPKTNSAYWQTKIDRNKERDLQKRTALQKDGYVVVAFWEHEIQNHLSDCIDHLIEMIEDSLLNSIAMYPSRDR